MDDELKAIPAMPMGGELGAVDNITPSLVNNTQIIPKGVHLGIHHLQEL